MLYVLRSSLLNVLYLYFNARAICIRCIVCYAQFLNSLSLRRRTLWGRRLVEPAITTCSTSGLWWDTLIKWGSDISNYLEF